MTEKKWADMTWEERREERFKRWLSPEGVTFDSPEAEKLYKQRVTRFIKAIKMEEPDRVPVTLPAHTYPATYGGINFKTIMYDYPAMKKAWLKFMDDFGDMDNFTGPGLVPSGIISEAIGSYTQKLPGLGLPDDAPTNQFVEGEYMKANEYDLMMRDLTDYQLRVNLPRTAALFESFAKLPPLRSLQGAAWVAALSDPDVRKTFETLMGLSDEYKKWTSAVAEIREIAIGRGYGSLHGGGLFAGAPFDHFADALRGTQGIIMDMFRQPKKLHEAMDWWLDMTIETTVKNFPMTNCPVVMMPLHKGDDVFMSDAQFEEFYWPTLRKLFLAMMDEGLVPYPFAEGRYNNRLKQIADTPKSGVVWYFDQTDMAEAKKILGNTSCIVGNVASGLIMTGKAADVKERCRELIEACAPGGGYILAGGASVEKGPIENLKAMMEAAYEYGKY